LYPTDLGFTGQALDPHTGLMYYRARWYDPRLGRFVQADTVVPEAGRPQALNRYAYVYNNPVRYADPSGHAVCIDEECRQVVRPIIGGTELQHASGDVSQLSLPKWIMWGLFAYELGPRNEQGEPLIEEVFSPWPDLSGESSEIIWRWGEHSNAVLLDVYGGEEALLQKVIEACQVNRCNNPWLDTDPALDTDLWSGFRFETREFLAINLVGTGQGVPLGYFLREIGASPVNPANYEPWWMWTLQQLYPKELLIAQGRWVKDVYVTDWKVWHQVFRGGWGGWRIITTDVPPPPPGG
jgi:RHS repeat-associated protein